jgi:hypothetical protein
VMLMLLMVLLVLVLVMLQWWRRLVMIMTAIWLGHRAKSQPAAHQAKFLGQLDSDIDRKLKSDQPASRLQARDEHMRQHASEMLPRYRETTPEVEEAYGSELYRRCWASVLWCGLDRISEICVESFPSGQTRARHACARCACERERGASPGASQ